MLMTDVTPFGIQSQTKARCRLPGKIDIKRAVDSDKSNKGDAPIRRNTLLSMVAPDEMERIQPHLEQIDYTFRQPMYESGQPQQFAFFPHAGVFSMVSDPHGNGGLLVEVATVGHEGFVGLPLLLGTDRTPGDCFCQVPGQAARIPRQAFEKLVATCPGLRRTLLRYTQALIIQISQGAACNRMHPIEQRCARWLLMTQDRVGKNHFTLTQQFLAQMLGVQRPSVSAAGMLQKAGLISYARGLIVIADRKGLEAAACDCYRIIQDEFNRLFGQPAAPSGPTPPG